MKRPSTYLYDSRMPELPEDLWEQLLEDEEIDTIIYKWQLREADAVEQAEQEHRRSRRSLKVVP